MFYFWLERIHQFAVLREHSQIEIVMIVGNEYFIVRIYANADRIVCDAFAANLPQIGATVVEYFYAMSPIVRYVNLFAIIVGRVRIRTAHAVRKLQILWAIEFVQHVAIQIEYDDAHYFAFDNHNTTFVVDVDAARMLQYRGAEFAQKLTILVVDLYLMRWRTLCNNNIACLLYNAHTIRIQQLAVSFAAFAKFKLEITVAIEYLYAMRIGVCHYDVVVGVYCDTARLRELAIVYAEFAKFTMIDHFLPLYLYAWVGFEAVQVVDGALTR